MAIEAQTRADRQMPLRLLEYTSMQHREFEKPVYPVVLNLTGRPQVESYSFDCLDLTVMSFNYLVINLAEMSGQEFLRRGPAGIIPLVPLMRHHLPDDEVLIECARRVKEAPAERQSDLYLGLAIFSSLRFTRELILKIIEVSKMEASPLFDGIREKWINQGEKKGIQQGAYNERVEAILDALKENTGSYPDNVLGIWTR